MLPLAIMAQRLQAIARWYTQGLQHRSRMELFQLVRSYPLYILREFARELPAEELFGFLALERFDHAENIAFFVNNAKRYG
jgi:hypothetical protein